jgi:hypothetical protein
VRIWRTDSFEKPHAKSRLAAGLPALLVFIRWVNNSDTEFFPKLLEDSICFFDMPSQVAARLAMDALAHAAQIIHGSHFLFPW